MGINIGLDIGSVSLKLAAIGMPADGSLFRTLTGEHATFFSAQFPTRMVLMPAARCCFPATVASTAVPSSPPSTCSGSFTRSSRAQRRRIRVTGPAAS